MRPMAVPSRRASSTSASESGSTSRRSTIVASACGVPLSSSTACVARRGGAGARE
jgi:hypothetical protein